MIIQWKPDPSNPKYSYLATVGDYKFMINGFLPDLKDPKDMVTLIWVNCPEDVDELLSGNIYIGELDEFIFNFINEMK